MNKSKITIEYDEACLVEQRRVPHKNNKKSYSYKTFKVNDPKAWEVITVENTTSYTPGQRLTKKQVQGLCSGAGYHIEIGMPGQFRQHNSRY